VQLEPVEEDPEEVEMEEEPVEQPQLYDGTVLEADADGDVVIPPAPMVADEAPPAPVAPAPDSEGGDPDDSGDDSGNDDDDNNARRRKRMRILAIVERCITSTPPRMRMSSYVSFCEKFCSTWGTP
jgi:hypothetical protein